MGRPHKKQQSKRGGRKNPREEEDEDEQQPAVAAPDSVEDDEEIPEDEAFNSDDERKYGAFFQNGGGGVGGGASSDEEGGSDDDDRSSASDDDDDEDEGDGGQYMLDLLDQLDDGNNKKKGNDKNESSASSTMKTVSAVAKESEFSSSVVPTAGLTLDSLLEGLETTRGFGTVQRAMQKVAQGNATSAPLAKVASDRQRRQLHYADQTKEVSQWISAVQENRQAETLDFRPKDRLEVTKDALVEKFVPTTDFERQVAAALEEAGQHDEEALLAAEEAALRDDLGSSSITVDEYRERHGRLAKMRSLLFSYEQKRHHMKKIKSRKYRRIRKRQRERHRDAELDAATIAEDDPAAAARELQENEELERMKERMTLAHKNTSKWAKRVLKRGKNVDMDTRKALSAQLKRGDDLLSRMKSTRAGEDGDSDGDDEDLAETARKVLADEDGAAGDDDGKGQGLFKMSFMQKGIEKQRQKAREEARQLLQELEAQQAENDDDYSDGDDDDVSDASVSRKKVAKAKPKVASKEEMKRVLGQDEMVVSQLKDGNSNNNTVVVSGAIDIDLLGGSKNNASSRKNNKAKDSEDNQKQQNTGSMSIHTSTIVTAETSASKNKEQATIEDNKNTNNNKSSLNDREKKAATPALVAGGEDSNPWLTNQQQQKAVASESKAKKRSASSTGQPFMVDVERAIDLLEPARGDNHKVDAAVAPSGDDVADPSSNNNSDDNKKITTLTQEQLVRRAFASAADKEADDDFAREKAAVGEEEEDPTRKKKSNGKNEKGAGADDGTVSGWGSWAGKGAPPPPPPRKLPKHLQPPGKQLPKRKRADEKKPNVIISEKRVKRTADKFMLAQVPYPFTSREEYERAMAGGIGREWNVTSSHKDMTRPEIITRAGKVIQPLSKRVKHQRPAAKF